jgi:hypothetical protein
VERSNSVATGRRDPLAIDTALPLRGSYHPAGFLLHIATNSQDVLDAARESWSHYPEQVYPCDAIEFRVVVEPEGALCGIPVHRAQGHLYSVVADADNFAALDLKLLRGSIFVSALTAADHVCLRWFFVESLAYMMLAQRYLVPVHAACVARASGGILLCGQSEAGKSTLAYACARAGWTYLSDDAVFLLPDDEHRIAIGRHRQFRFRLDAPQLFPELGGFISRARPNGKVAIEVPVSELAQVRAAERAPITGIVVLDRRAGAEPRLDPISVEEVLMHMLGDMPSYGAEVNEMHERSIRRLAEVRAFRLRYGDLDGAVACLGEIDAAMR